MTVRRRKWTDPKTGQTREAWLVDVDFEHADGTRTRVRKRSPVQTRKGAEAYEKQVRDQLLAGTYGRNKEDSKEAQPVLFGAFADEVLRDYSVNHNKPSTVKFKRVIIENHLKPAFGQKALGEIVVRDIEGFVAMHKASGAAAMTINNYLIVLRRILSLAVEYGLLEKVPKVRKLKLGEQKFDFLSFEEAARLLDAAKAEPEWGTMILLALKTGLRQGELLALQWADVDLEAGRMVVRRSVWEGHETTPKSHKPREIPLSIAGEVLAEHKHVRGAYVFCDKDGERLNKQQCRRPLTRALQRAGLRHIGWHGLRHTFASHLVMRGVPLPAVKELLGHSTITVTMRYAHLSPQAKNSAIALLDPRPGGDGKVIELKNGAHPSGTMTAQGPAEGAQTA
jgi:integrase